MGDRTEFTQAFRARRNAYKYGKNMKLPTIFSKIYNFNIL